MIIDDATRLVVNCKICERQDTWNVLDSFWQALELYGIPERIFTDNGSQYVSRQLTQVCAKLGIKKLRARPRRASAKGKVEAFNRYLDSFVEEVKLKRPQRAVEVQHYLDIWLLELYQRKPHSALSGKTPEQVFKEDDRPLRWATKEELDYGRSLYNCLRMSVELIKAGEKPHRAVALAEELVEAGELKSISSSDISREEAYNSLEMFAFTVGIAVVPIVKYDEKVIGTGKPGPVFRRLLKLFQRDYTENRELLTPVPYDEVANG